MTSLETLDLGCAVILSAARTLHGKEPAEDRTVGYPLRRMWVLHLIPSIQDDDHSLQLSHYHSSLLVRPFQPQRRK